MSTNTLKTAVLASLLVAGAFATSANAQFLRVNVDPHARHVNEQMGKWKAEMRSQGYRRIIFDDRGVIYADERQLPFRLWLRGGVEYRFAARCDGDCSDLDLVLENSAGQEVRADRDPDDTPGFRYTVPWSGEYTLTLVWADGSAGRTQVGAAVVSR